MSVNRRRKRRRVFQRNITLYSVVLVFLAALGVLSFFILRTELLKNTQDLGESLARSYSSEERNNLTVYETLLDFGTEIIDTQTAQGRPKSETKEMIHTFFQQMQASLGDRTVDPYVLMDGEIVAANPWEGDATYDAQSTNWYRNALAADGEPVFTNLYTDAVYNRPVITISQKCSESDTVMAFDIFPENFQFQSNPLGSSHPLSR